MGGSWTRRRRGLEDVPSCQGSFQRMLVVSSLSLCLNSLHFYSSSGLGSGTLGDKFVN